jgi:protein TonB
VLDEAAVEAVKTWSFVPATQGGAPVGGSVVVPIVFHLQ